MSIYTLDEIRALIKPLHDLELEPVIVGGEELPDIYFGLLSMNDAKTSGEYLVVADDREHGEAVQITKPAANFLLKGPEVIQFLLKENERLRQERDNAIEAADECISHQH